VAGLRQSQIAVIPNRKVSKMDGASITNTTVSGLLNRRKWAELWDQAGF
jgi:hypothetical protein